MWEEKDELKMELLSIRNKTLKIWKILSFSILQKKKNEKAYSEENTKSVAKQ